MKRFGLFLALMGIVFVLRGQYDFGEYTVIHQSTKNGAAKVIAADLNSDGRKDLIAINRYSPSRIDWYQNLGSGIFTGEIPIAIQSGARDIEAADINGDSKVDLIVCSEWDDRIYWYENDGAGNFTQHLITQSADGVLSIDVKDVDGDNDNDVVAVARNNNYLYLFTNNGSGTFTENIITTSANGPYSVCFIDALQNDDHLDILVGSDNSVNLFVNDGSESFYKYTIDAGIAEARDMSVADINGDGKEDFAVAAYNNNAIYWYENNSTATSVNFSKNTVVTGFTQANAVSIADIDLDGHMDILGGCFYPRKVSLFKNDGSNNFPNETVIFPYLWSVFSIQTADLTGDGKPEILTASVDDDRIMYFENPSWTPHYISQTMAAAYSVLSFDINNDHLNDIVFSSRYDHKVAYFLNQGNASFSYEYNLSLNNPQQPMYIINADLNNDGFQDIIVAGSEENTLSYFLGNGTGFGYQQFFDTKAYGIMQLDAADFNNDGFVDIVAPLSGVNQVMVFLNNNLTFTRDTVFSYLYGAYITKAADLTQDGKQDIVAYGQTEKKLLLFKNTTTSPTDVSFDNPVKIDSGKVISSIALADPDKDGDIDILVTMPDNHLIAIYRNNGNANFSFDTIFNETTTKPEILYVTDITDDGDLDLVVLCFNNWAQNAVKVLENKGDGTYNYPSFLGNPYTPDHPNAVTVNDLDNDGDKEIIVGSTWASDLGYFENYALYYIQHPQNQEVCEGDTVFFHVEAYGVEHYQWYKDGQPLSESAMYKGVHNDTLYICGATLDIDSADFYCVIENDIATNESKHAKLTVYQFVQAFAGDDTRVCQNSYVLQGNNPAPGTGMWTLLNGSGYFSDQTDPNATLINMSVDTMTLTWEITNGLCFSIDTVNLFVDSLVLAQTQDDFDVCETDSVQINANPVDSIYSGVWQIVSGSGNILSPTSSTTYITELPRQQPVFLTWTVTNGTCVSTDTLKIINDTLIYAYAMNDTVICTDSITVYANEPPEGSIGYWNVVTGNALFEHPDSNVTLVSNLNDGINILTWSIQNGACVSSDYLTISLYPSVHIVNQPVDLTVDEGAIARFSVEVDGDAHSYQWFKDYDNPIVDDTVHYLGATSPDLFIAGVVPEDEGYYNCVISSLTCGSVISDTVYLTVIPSASVNGQFSYLLVYPNPASDRIFIKTDYAEKLNLRLTDMNGKILITKFSAGNLTQLDISFLPAGYYVLEVEGEKFIRTIKVVKQ